MMFRQLELSARSRPGEVAVIVGQRNWTYEEMFVHADRLSRQLPRQSDLALAVGTSNVANLMIALAAADGAGRVPVILPPAAIRGDWRDVRQQTPFDVVIAEDASDCLTIETAALSSSSTTMRQRDSLIVFTSGTSGPPKPVVHSWATLTAGVKTGEQYQQRRWLFAFAPWSFAGLQVVMQSLFTGGALITAAKSIALIPEQLRRCEIEYASATPTFWRLLLHELGHVPSSAPLKQITLGGEIAEQPLLDGLREAFPAARITQIYASTEMGACFSVHDVLQGFPASWLNNTTFPCGLRVADDGELLIKSPRRMQSYYNERFQEDDISDWFATGDVVEVVDERVLFRGRKRGIISVGGQKFAPDRIEAVIREVSGVEQVRAFGVASSIMGEVAAVELQVAADCDPSTVRECVLTACRQRLPKYMVPATISIASHTQHPPGELMTGNAR